ncbi:radical SAM protein [Myxococcota bacterium]
MTNSPTTDRSTTFYRTRSFCCDCQQLHEAALRSENGAVALDVYCPHGQQSAPVSSDAATFRAVRAKSVLPEPCLDSARGFSWINILEITRDCNCKCPICFAESHPGAGGYLSVSDVELIAKRLKKEGLKAISLSGGEPTLHPDLFDLVAAVRKRGLDVTLISNGLLIGQDPALAEKIRKSGIIYIYLQLDTLRADVCKKIRGDELVETRKRALENVKKSGMHFGTNATIVRDNVEEVGALLKHATEHVPNLAIVTFLTAGKTGRFLLDDAMLVTREDIIASLIRSGEVEGLTVEHFWPFPRFAPLALDVHPDCAVLLPLAVDRGRIRPLEEYLDIARFFRRLGAARGGLNRAWAFVLFSWYFLLSIRPRGILPMMRMLFGLVTQRGRSSLMTVVVEQFLHGLHQDQERVDRCTTCAVLEDGQRVPMCVYQHADPRRTKHTRIGEAHSSGNG